MHAGRRRHGPIKTGGDEDVCRLIGGQLPVGLRALGIERDDITDVVCTHLHPDHVGWLFDLESKPIFPRATIWFGAGDWRHFVERHDPLIQDHIREGFRLHTNDARLRPIDRDTTVAAGVTAIGTPGHTPGHLCVVVASGGQRVLILGDAITCPVQLDESTWHSIGDVDPDLASRTRERLWRELEGEDATGTGAHFPELRFGRVLSGSGKRWWA
jgi:glyoxylase-like metal-dependent hydrolase (beta-lactamase superfamily II)